LAETALSYAAQITEKSGTIQLIIVLATADKFFVPTSNSVKKIDEQMVGARQYLAGITKQLKTNYGVSVNTKVKVGDPAQTIAEAAQSKQVDAIVMSTHGRSGMSKVIFGSVTQKILQLTPCPIFIIPGRQVAKTTKPLATRLRPATN